MLLYNKKCFIYVFRNLFKMVRNRKQPERKIGNVSSERMKDAVNEVIEGGKSIRSVGKMYDIKFSTLRRYVTKAKENENKESMSYAPCYNCRQIFTENEERLLHDYLIKASNIQYGLTRTQVRKLAYDFASCNKKNFPESWSTNGLAGEDWFSGYMTRFPNLALRRPEATSLSRATSFNKTNVKNFFDNLETVLQKYKFSPNDIYNTDETGCTTVQIVRNTRVIACKNQKQVGKITSGERGTLVTMLGTINAAGNSVAPFMVFPRVHFKESMLHGAPPGTVGASHQTGWMTAEIFKTFMEHFIKSTKCSKQRPVLLILDNHDTHLSIETIDLAKDNGVIMLTLPPHCSHKLQPLDRSVYGPFKAFYNQAANAFMINHPGTPITIYDIAQIVGNAFPSAFTPKNIIVGFKVTGIYPFNPNVFSDDDFLCSYVTDRPEAPEETTLQPTEQVVNIPESSSALDVTATQSQLPEPVASTSTNTDKRTITVTPEEISPFPKAPPRKTKGGRKKAKTRVLTDTPVKEEIRAAVEKKKRKKEVGTMARGKKLKLQTEDVDVGSSTSNDEEDETFCDNDSSDYDEVGQNQLDDIELPDPTVLNPNDFVLIKFVTNKTKVIYIGQIQNRIDETTFEVKYLRREKPNSFTFIFPSVDDISDISFEDVAGKLPSPIQHGGTARVARHLVFPVDFSCYSNMLR